MSTVNELYVNWIANKIDQRPAREIAAEIAKGYQRSRKKHSNDADNKLIAALCQHMPEPAAQELASCLHQRLARGDSEAFEKLASEITIAVDDARHWSATAHPIMRPIQQARPHVDGQPMKLRSSCGKVIAAWFAGAPRVVKGYQQAIARDIVQRYHQRAWSGSCRSTDYLFLELCEVLPEKSALEIFTRFRQRSARSDPKAELKLEAEIAIALSDADVFSESK